VLAQDGFLLPPGGLADAYEEFAAVYLELRSFDPGRLAQTFPALAGRFSAVDEVLAGDVPAADLLARSRPEGAPDPLAHAEEEPHPEEPLTPFPPTPAPADPAGRSLLLRRADRAAGRGNRVRAAIFRQRGAHAAATPELAATLTVEALRDLDELAGRLQQALDLPEEEVSDWRRSLTALLEPAAHGIWSVEARLLYDLQKVCVDCERDLYAVDLVEWFVSFFRRPIKRLLPDQGLVLAVKHLRSAVARVGGVHVAAEVRQQLSELLHRALHRAEQRLRERLRPRARQALEAVGLAPANVAEGVASNKLIEELLDRVVESGYLTVGDLRDALARNRLKLPDLAGPVEFFAGDPLIRANRQLAADLDGIYHRGEIYLRWLQRLSSLFFGNPVGRFLTLYLILPLAGSFFILKGIDGISEELHHLHMPKLHTFNPYSFVLLALFLLPLLHVATFRRLVGTVLGWFWRGVRGVCYDGPAWVLRQPLVRRVLQSRLYLFLFQYVGKPLGVAAPLAGVLYLAGVDPVYNLAISAGVFVATGVLVSSRLGMYVEEWWADRLWRTWQLLSRDVLPGLFRLVMDFFKRLVADVERVLYTVDEWLRFRSGQGRAMFVLKLVLGSVWFLVTYVVRFGVNLLIEPQINPVKHFPVVTVSHKLMILAAPPLAQALAPQLGVSYDRALALVGGVIWLIPGIFGFLVWELKENWRLYKANQPPLLGPVAVGSHGETVLRLLRPGFHSGTVPKLYARLRRARTPAAAHKRLEDLNHVSAAVRHFVERDLLGLLALARSWHLPMAVGEVSLATNRVRVELRCRELPGPSVLVDFAYRSGWLVADLARTGWLAGLRPWQLRTFRDALAGLYKLAGIDLVRQQLEAALRSAGADYEITERGLVVGMAGRAIVYELDGESPTAEGQAELRPEQVLFRRVTISWDEWVARWERDRAGKGREAGLLPGLRLVPVGPPDALGSLHAPAGSAGAGAARLE
jgi:hypothetical protein